MVSLPSLINSALTMKLILLLALLHASFTKEEWSDRHAPGSKAVYTQHMLFQYILPAGNPLCTGCCSLICDRHSTTIMPSMQCFTCHGVYETYNLCGAVAFINRWSQCNPFVCLTYPVMEQMLHWSPKCFVCVLVCPKKLSISAWLVAFIKLVGVVWVCE